MAANLAKDEYLSGKIDVNDLSNRYQDIMRQVFTSHHTGSPVNTHKTTVSKTTTKPIDIVTTTTDTNAAADDARNKVAVALADRRKTTVSASPADVTPAAPAAPDSAAPEHGREKVAVALAHKKATAKS